MIDGLGWIWIWFSVFVRWILLNTISRHYQYKIHWDISQLTDIFNTNARLFWRQYSPKRENKIHEWSWLKKGNQKKSVIKFIFYSFSRSQYIASLIWNTLCSKIAIWFLDYNVSNVNGYLTNDNWNLWDSSCFTSNNIGVIIDNSNRLYKVRLCHGGWRLLLWIPIDFVQLIKLGGNQYKMCFLNSPRSSPSWMLMRPLLGLFKYYWADIPFKIYISCVGWPKIKGSRKP